MFLYFKLLKKNKIEVVYKGCLYVQKIVSPKNISAE